MRCQNCKTYIPEGIALDKCPACNTSIAPNNPSGLSQSAVSSLDLMKVLRGSMPVPEGDTEETIQKEWELRNLSSKEVEELERQSAIPVQGSIKGTLEWDSSVLNMLVFMLIAHPVAAFVVNAVSNPASTGSSVGSLFWALIFTYYLVKGRSWAKTWLVVRLCLTILIVIGTEMLANNILGGILDFVMLACALVVLVGKVSKRAAKIYLILYIVAFCTLTAIWANAIYSSYSEKNALQNEQSPQSFSSTFGYTFSLPNDKWKILSKETVAKYMSKAIAEKADLAIAKIDRTAFGLFYPEIESKRWEVDAETTPKLVSTLKETYFTSNVKNIEEKTIENGVVVFGSDNVQGTDYFRCVFFKREGVLGIVGYFWGGIENETQFKADLPTLLGSITVLSPKERLEKMTGKEIFEKYNEAVVLIRSYDEKGKIVGFGSGFNVNKDGLIVTNLHVLLGGGNSVDVKFPRHGVYEDVVIDGISDADTDLALLSIDTKDIPMIGAMKSVPVEVGDKVYVIGNPEGLTNSLSEGIVSGIRSDEGVTLYQITAPISSGSSGGVVFNEFGEIIGISKGAIESGQNLNFCVSIDEIPKITRFKKRITLQQFKEALEEDKADKK